MFQEDFGNDIEGLRRCVTDYIRLCEGSAVPIRKLRFFPNNKPWINTDVKLLLNRKKKAFMAGDKGIAQKEIQSGLRRELRTAKSLIRTGLRESYSTAMPGGFD